MSTECQIYIFFHRKTEGKFYGIDFVDEAKKKVYIIQ
jgi:hypothetical protein